MTEHLRAVPPAPRRPPRRRASRGSLRAWAWMAGAAGFLVPSGILGLAPKPAASAVPMPSSGTRPVVIIHHVIRKVVVQSSPRVVTTGGSLSSPVVVTGGGAAPPALSTGGSHP
jgi:hypothetical protein